MYLNVVEQLKSKDWFNPHFSSKVQDKLLCF
jgi:hypothetical protein